MDGEDAGGEPDDDTGQRAVARVAGSPAGERARAAAHADGSGQYRARLHGLEGRAWGPLHPGRE